MTKLNTFKEFMRIKYYCSIEAIKMQTNYRNFTLKLIKERLCFIELFKHLRLVIPSILSNFILWYKFVILYRDINLFNRSNSGLRILE